ncbi:MAG: transposase [Candidatus Binatia bacterium]
MPQPRYTQIDIEATSYYHVISRCVRRAFLCGYDRATAQCFDHRKGWVLDKLAALTEIFAIHLQAYAVLANHVHLVVRIDTAQARAWSATEVVARYGALFPRTAARWASFPETIQARRVALWRARLSDLSWFMRCLNETIARRANQEDGCTGRFWEGRFRSQALLDAAAVLTCLSYVDLNPLRAGLATSLAASAFTSIQQRLEEATPARGKAQHGEVGYAPRPRRPTLAPFAVPGSGGPDQELPVGFAEYVELLTATGAAVRAGPSAAPLEEASQRLLDRVGIDHAHWVETVRDYRRHFFTMVGHVQRIAIHCARTDRDRAKGSVWARRVFRRAA